VFGWDWVLYSTYLARSVGLGKGALHTWPGVLGWDRGLFIPGQERLSETGCSTYLGRSVGLGQGALHTWPGVLGWDRVL